MERGGGSSRPSSFYSQTSTSSCCSLADSRAEMRTLMDSFMADVQRIRDTFPDPSAAPSGFTASPARSDGDVDMAPVPGAYEVRPPSPALETQEHKGIWCDSCNQKVFGIRHKCLDCYNYDLCDSCMTTKDIQSTHADMPHTFEVIYPPKPKSTPKSRSPSRGGSRPSSPLPKCLCSVLPRPQGCEVCKLKKIAAPKKTPSVPKGTPSYRCDSCQNIINDTRHKCMNCPDYDLCDACYVSGFPVFDHSPVHRFMHIEHPVRVVTAPAMIASDSTSPFAGGCVHEGPRYKCENCDDVDLCMDCLGNLERATIQHAAWHTEQQMDKPVRFVPYTKNPTPQTPTSSTVPLATHQANCDACDKTIVGTRHKCTVCFDFDLCDACYSAGAQPIDHKSEHEMLHLERPQRVVTHVVGPGRGPVTRPVATGSTGTATPNALHNAWCDACSERIRGIRHKCLDCPDFDLCDACFVPKEHCNGEHEFYALMEPGQVVVRNVPEPPARPRGRPQTNVQSIPPSIPAPPAPPVVPTHQVPRPARPGPPSHPAACDMCSSRIRGVRYKCTACPDYDVCESCFRVSEEVHPGHSFAKIYKQGDIIVRKAPQTGFRHHARCDVCQKQILGTRYKCIHPSCPDFDICERCEAMPFAVHPETHAFIKLKTHISNYDGLRNVLSFAADRGQATQPQSSARRIPVPAVRIPTPSLQIPASHASRSPVAGYPEPVTSTEVFHTATPSPIVPLSTLGCTIVPHTTIVPSLPHTPVPEPRMSPQVVSPPAIPSPIPSPPPIPASTPTPERKLTDSWTAASSSAKLDEHKMHHSDMYKPSYEAPSVAESYPRGRRMNGVETAPRPSVTIHEERDPEAPQMTLVNSRPVSLPDVPAHEPVVREPTPEPIRVVIPEPFVIPEPVVAIPEPVVAVEPASIVVAEPEPVVMAEPEPIVVAPESESESESEFGSESGSESIVICEPTIVIPAPVRVAPEPEPELPALLPPYPYRLASPERPAPLERLASPEPGSPIPDMVSVVSSRSPSVSSGSIISYTSPYGARFVEDRTIVDGQLVPGGAEFTKVWRMFNTGTAVWPQGTSISFVGGHHMTPRIHWDVAGDLSPGQHIDLEVNMKAPEVPGHYRSIWRLKTPEGEAFGDPVWCEIEVAEIEHAGSSGHSEVSASSIIVPTRAPGMSVATFSSAPGSPVVQSLASTVRSESVTDMVDDDDDISIGSNSDNDSVWEEIQRAGQGLSPH
ncbi:unnamed protein product [Rhizoctonia solani]|uniref:ZZ-type domain-containing protein n=1 Tax=Rhizoctonia solani TaxID=456999 RepID=A0A8H3D665_9AGAM|nr:unnamed protein product [Rhizoctonia solani]